MCEYCEGDIWDRKTIESDLHNEYTVGENIHFSSKVLIKYIT